MCLECVSKIKSIPPIIFMEYMILCVFRLPISLMMIVADDWRRLGFRDIVGIWDTCHTRHKTPSHTHTWTWTRPRTRKPWRKRALIPTKSPQSHYAAGSTRVHFFPVLRSQFYTQKARPSCSKTSTRDQYSSRQTMQHTNRKLTKQMTTRY